MPNDPIAAVVQYVAAFNRGDAKAMAATCADPMQILDGMAPHVWQGPTASEDWWRDVLTEGAHLGATPACYGFTVIAKVKPGTADAVREYGHTLAKALEEDPYLLAPLKLHYLRWVLSDDDTASCITGSSTPTSTSTPRTPSPFSQRRA
ncbi:hypothetical protein [Streptomyces sp. NPDC093984]|uniref:hypothetical protein n=1 Tax=Streptomyces sp. NPDC093984 TaxID=3366052 RepID=UPI00380F1610